MQLAPIVTPDTSYGGTFGRLHGNALIQTVGPEDDRCEQLPSEAIDCPDQSVPVRPSWCRSTKDAWGGANWSVSAAIIDRRANPPIGMMVAGWLPTQAFAQQWVSFVTKPEHPVRLPP